MDVYCPRCGEPWDLDSLHEEAAFVYGIPYYKEEPDPYSFRPAKVKNPDYDEDAYQKVFREVQRDFQRKGCAALAGAFGVQKCEPEDEDAERDRTYGLTRGEASATLYELLGDDMDGAAAMLDDLGF